MIAYHGLQAIAENARKAITERIGPCKAPQFSAFAKFLRQEQVHVDFEKPELEEQAIRALVGAVIQRKFHAFLRLDLPDGCDSYISTEDGISVRVVHLYRPPRVVRLTPDFVITWPARDDYRIDVLGIPA